MTTQRRSLVGLTLCGLGIVALGLSGCGFVNEAAVGTWEGDLAGATLKFTGEGVITGSDGCHSLSGTWSESGSEVTVSMFPLLNPACDDAPAWVADAQSATVEGTMMSLFGANRVHLGDLDRISRP